MQNCLLILFPTLLIFYINLRYAKQKHTWRNRNDRRYNFYYQSRCWKAFWNYGCIGVLNKLFSIEHINSRSRTCYLYFNTEQVRTLYTNISLQDSKRRKGICFSEKTCRKNFKKGIFLHTEGHGGYFRKRVVLFRVPHGIRFLCLCSQLQNVWPALYKSKSQLSRSNSFCASFSRSLSIFILCFI